MSRFIRWLDQVRLTDVAAVGGKNASLGEMIGELASQGVNVPGGFVVTADAYTELLDQGGSITTSAGCSPTSTGIASTICPFEHKWPGR